MSEYMLTYELKQQTPMIHFQYNEPGACIRASELKPKLDKFLCNKYPDKVNGWKLEGQDALDYKVRIIPQGPPSCSQTVQRDIELHALGNDRDGRRIVNNNYKSKSINGMYFGNMVKTSMDQKKYAEEVRKTYKETVFYNDPVNLEIICFVKDLRDAIKDNIAEFFTVTNFGTRQSKGFGGFCVEGKTEEQTKEMLKSKGYSFFYFCVPDQCKTIDEKMNMAAAVYNVMKGGINYSKLRKNAYIKGYIQRQFFKDNGWNNIGSEKAGIKSEVITAKGDKKEKYEKYKFSRAILGLADHYEFRDNYRKGTVNIKSQNNEIERFKSAVTIKIVGKCIFFIFNDTFELILGKTFDFESGQKIKTVSVPSSFDTNKFIGDFIKYFECEKYKFEYIGNPYSQAKNIKLERGDENNG